MLARCIVRLPVTSRKQLSKWMAISYDKNRLSRILDNLQQFLTLKWLNNIRSLTEVSPVVQLMEIVYTANEMQTQLYPGREVIRFDQFYNEVVNEQLNIHEDYRRWRLRQSFSFCTCPFLLDAATKSRILQIESAVQMHEQLEQSLFESIMTGRAPYLVLRVHRNRLIQDTLSQLQKQNSHDLKKPLKVQFIGEQGVDEGGVKKEFFQLIISELFDPKYGMFAYSKKNRVYWFRKNALDSASEFELIGIILGLAIYNSVILDIRFPLVVYKKLLSIKTSLQDLIEAKPALGRGLKQMLEFNGDVENTYCRTFSVDVKSFGSRNVVDLKKDGRKIAVTAENRKEYVDLHTDWVLNKSIEKQFAAFKDGFLQVAGGDGLKLCRPEELELLICGSEKLDFEALEQACEYEAPFSASSRVIKDFWSVVHSLSEDEKRRFLFFCTGSDRVPIKGLGSLAITISRQGPDSDRLPSSHTCFNHLLLPEYSDKVKLEKFLKIALANNKGFGLI